MKITKITRLPAPGTTENGSAVRIPAPAPAKTPETPERKPSPAKITPAIPAPETPDYYASRGFRAPETDDDFVFVHLSEYLRENAMNRYDLPEYIRSSRYDSRFDDTIGYIDCYYHSPHGDAAEYHRKTAVWYACRKPFETIRETLKPYEGKPIGDKRAREIRDKINSALDCRDRDSFGCYDRGYQYHELGARVPDWLNGELSQFEPYVFAPHDRKTGKTTIDLTAVTSEQPQETPIRYLISENDPVAICRMIHRLEARERIRANEEAETLDALRKSWYASIRKR